MRIPLREMVLDLPRKVAAKLARQLDLSQRILRQMILAMLLPRFGQLVLVEDTEFHEADAPRQNIYPYKLGVIANHQE